MLFSSSVANFTGYYSGGSWTTPKGRWPGKSIRTLKFANGSITEVETMAFWPASNGAMSYETGEELFRVACLPTSPPVLGSFPGRFPAPNRPSHSAPLSGPLAYPAPVLHDRYHRISGYYLDSAMLNNVAVLQIPTFTTGHNTAEFSTTAIEFIKQAAADRKTKMVLDLSNNRGGDLIPGYNLFKVFFPHAPIYSATRFRATELIGLMGLIYSEVYLDDAPLDLPLVYREAARTGPGFGFRSWSDFYGPHEVLGHNMSSLYTIFDFDRASTKLDPISGFGQTPLDPPSQIFKAQDIIMVSTPLTPR